MTRVAILGATGYSALELIKILLRHPGVEIALLTSRQDDNPHIAKVHPCLTGRLDLRCENPPPAVFFYALTKEAKVGLKVVDANKKVLRELEVPKGPGLHRVTWNLTGTPRKPMPGQQPRPASVPRRSSSSATRSPRMPESRSR